MQLGNDVLFLVSSELDLQDWVKLILSSDNNLLTTSKQEYDKWENYKYQAFSGTLKVEVKNFAVFTPFELEFVRVIPIISEVQDKEEKQNILIRIFNRLRN